MRLIDADALIKTIETWDWQELYLPIYFKEMGIDQAQTVEPEPVYFPPCVDCQNRSKEILTAYNNMKKMQMYTKEEVITMLDKIRAEIEELKPNNQNFKGYFEQNVALNKVLEILDKYKAESEG